LYNSIKHRSTTDEIKFYNRDINMPRKEDLEKLKNMRFFSEEHGCFIEIKETPAGIAISMKGEKIEVQDSDKFDKLIDSLTYESKTKYRLDKRTSHAFGKDIYLIGKGTDAKLMWLEAPKWDCGWYWGFGYIEVYTNSNNPERAKDIISHSHFSGLVGAQEYYDHEKGCFRKGEYIHNIYDSPQLVETTFTEKEGWQLSELFKQFYLLRDMAAFCHKEKPGCHITESPVDHGNMKEWYAQINKIMIPKITAKILEILSPDVVKER